jgi:hypothetical protein
LSDSVVSARSWMKPSRSAAMRRRHNSKSQLQTWLVGG